MSNIKKIKAEIERLKNKNAEWRERINSEDGYSYESDVCCGYDEAIEDFESFIDSLPEEKPSEDLEEAAEEYRQGEVDSGCDYIDDSDGDSLYHSACLADAFIAGAEWQKSQMLKDAMEGRAHPEECEIWVNLLGYGYKYNAGDKVKIIIVKEEKA